jgi:hypothetical protein
MPDNQVRIISLAKALSEERHRVIKKCAETTCGRRVMAGKSTDIINIMKNTGEIERRNNRIEPEIWVPFVFLGDAPGISAVFC